MLKSAISSLGDFIKENNTYFLDGFSNAFHSANGYVAHGNQVIFPGDNRGPYFYIRRVEKVSVVNDNFNKISDCNLAIALKSELVIVACVLDADPDKLITNLLLTLQKFGPHTLGITSVLYDKDYVIEQELSGIEEKDIESALQRVNDNQTIVSIGLTITVRVNPVRDLSCITNPCNTC